MGTHSERVAIVTGAARGIGQSTARMLAARGATVVGVDLLDLGETRDQVEAEGGSWLGLTADVSSPDDVRQLTTDVDRAYGRCDILVNNAGIYPFTHFDELGVDEWRRVLSINLDGPFLLCKALIPLMARNEWGRIVNVVSSSVEVTAPGMSAYKASKLGLVGLTRGLASDVADKGIRVNAVSPTLTQTPGTMAEEETRQLLESYVLQAQAVKRIAGPDEVVPTILFLTSDDAEFVTGQTIYADGGAAYR